MTSQPQEQTEAIRAPEPSAPLVARFDNVRSARRAMASARSVPASSVVTSRPQRHVHFHVGRARWGLLGASVGAAIGALSAGLGAWLVADSVRPVASLPVSTASLIGGLLAGTLGLIAGLAFGEPRATKATTEALRTGQTDGEVAVRFDARPATREQVSGELRRDGAREVGSASRSAPG